jgi:hypothetical protein
VGKYDFLIDILMVAKGDDIGCLKAGITSPAHFL